MEEALGRRPVSLRRAILERKIDESVARSRELVVKNQTGRVDLPKNLFILLVGGVGFEPATPACKNETSLFHRVSLSDKQLLREL